MELKDPRPAPPDNGEQGERVRRYAHITSGLETWVTAKKILLAEVAFKNSRSLAMFNNYHLPRKNASYHLIILRGHVWGGKFQMAAMGERQVTSGNGRRF